MMTVHKLSFNFLFNDPESHLVDPNEAVDISLPVGSVFLKSAQNQRDRVCVWYVPGREQDPVNPRINTKTEKYRFWFLETGKTIPKIHPNGLDFLGTVLLEEGEYVLHVFVERHPVG